MTDQAHKDQPTTIAERIKHYRQDIGLTLTQLAEEARISKGYLSTLESGQTNSRPSGSTLYALAKALGVTMSDLLGQQLLTEETHDTPEALLQFAKADKLPQSDVRMLASIRFRGEPPRTPERWRYIYEAIIGSTNIDKRTGH